jgi:hypothetical protein
VLESPIQFRKRSQLLAGVHNETPSIATMGVNNPGCSPLRIDGWEQPKLNPPLLRLYERARPRKGGENAGANGADGISDIEHVAIGYRGG